MYSVFNCIKLTFLVFAHFFKLHTIKGDIPFPDTVYITVCTSLLPQYGDNFCFVQIRNHHVNLFHSNRTEYEKIYKAFGDCFFHQKTFVLSLNTSRLVYLFRLTTFSRCLDSVDAIFQGKSTKEYEKTRVFPLIPNHNLTYRPFCEKGKVCECLIYANGSSKILLKALNLSQTIDSLKQTIRVFSTSKIYIDHNKDIVVDMQVEENVIYFTFLEGTNLEIRNFFPNRIEMAVFCKGNTNSAPNISEIFYNIPSAQDMIVADKYKNGVRLCTEVNKMIIFVNMPLTVFHSNAVTLVYQKKVEFYDIRCCYFTEISIQERIQLLNFTGNPSIAFIYTQSFPTNSTGSSVIEKSLLTIKEITCPIPKTSTYATNTSPKPKYLDNLGTNSKITKHVPNFLKPKSNCSSFHIIRKGIVGCSLNDNTNERCYCLCQQTNDIYTPRDLESILHQLRTNLTVDKRSVTKNLMKKMCRYDPRLSAKYVGCFAIAIIVFILSLFPVLDLLRCLQIIC